MKIIVNGKIIDTENIYSISSETTQGTIFDDLSFTNVVMFGFTIESFNGKIEQVYLPLPTHEDMREAKKNIRGDINMNTTSIEDIVVVMKSENTPENNKMIYDSLCESIRLRVEKMRLDIVKVWLENQTTLKSFNIKNY